MGMRTAAPILFLLTTLLAAKEPILVFRPEGGEFAEVVRGMEREIGDDFAIGQRTLAPGASIADMAGPLRQAAPRLVVLMDNRIINLYKRFQASLPDSVPPPRSISLMAASLDREMEGLKLATGIAYEIPILTSTVDLRGILGKSLPRIGVIHRDYLSDFVSANKEYCRREGMALVHVSLKNKEEDFRKAVRKALRTLFEDEKVDALWVPNDNALLAPDLLRDVWIPMVNRYRKPVIVGVEALVQPGLGFGTFAVLPDHTELGRQLAEMVLELSASGSAAPGERIRQPLSVIKVMNLPQVRKFAGVGRESLGNVDRILE
jgi:hypothetical protein